VGILLFLLNNQSAHRNIKVQKSKEEEEVDGNQLLGHLLFLLMKEFRNS
jgi:hypothetical protein